jgi:L-lactate dehydrogenase
MQTRKVTVIGAGFVGSSITYTLMLSGLFNEIVLIDIAKDKVEGDVLDINHGLDFIPKTKLINGEYEDSKDSDIVIITAGVAQKPGETRLDLLNRNTSIFKSIVSELEKYCSKETIFLVVSNPVDILTYVTLKLLSVDRSRVFGSGTVLDSARFKYYVSKAADVSINDVKGYIIGEHGDTELPVFSQTTIEGKNIDKYFANKNISGAELSNLKNSLFENTKNAAYDIISKKGATYYAIALSVKRIVTAICHNENTILPISSLLTGEYDIEDVCIGLPTKINNKGAGDISHLDLSDTELNQLKTSSQALKDLISQINI